jgi:hypothetical protein
MLALTTAAGLCSAWWLAPVGFILWGFMVFMVARDPGLQITFTRQNREPLSQRYQVRFDRLDRARISIFNVIGQASPKFQRLVEPIQTSLDDLVEHAYQLGLRTTALDNHYAVQRLTSDFTSDIEELQRKFQETTDPGARKGYEQTIQSLQVRQEQLKSLANILDRYEAQLTGTMNAVDGVVTGVVSLKGRNPQQVVDKIDPLLQVLLTEEKELEQFEIDLQGYSVV